ncbi:OVARIAN TUMOR DOMAIN-containing deubiquitinating enzyme 4-like isoform X1 [Corylus avellana]|uniref:OVARIAN TUMOR DOMAIN-containing deubiquitinating enzyme 4-like isoform X1 n=1 Tax=Corylus avellana TaxID=13451 RepID=UPI00286AD223|nr:OVARIAN TUMOR DOMAIN-containing deubiquitinating enzyme 4-like isoform X1 [Corylus avellana]
MVFSFPYARTMQKSETSLGIPGDGRCLFRSIVHGACLRKGKPSPSESHQKELADELRAKSILVILSYKANIKWFGQVVDEFIKRRADTEWFLEGDFDTYVVQMRQPHIWGGEPELLMASHVLQMPITVYMKDKNSGSLKIIAEYGQEYGQDDPVRVLYHGYGHYDALRSQSLGAESKLYKKKMKGYLQ